MYPLYYVIGKYTVKLSFRKQTSLYSPEIKKKIVHLLLVNTLGLDVLL